VVFGVQPLTIVITYTGNAASGVASTAFGPAPVEISVSCSAFTGTVGPATFAGDISADGLQMSGAFDYPFLDSGTFSVFLN
jgi:pseudouridine-5'-phosphate glycosidase